MVEEKISQEFRLKITDETRQVVSTKMFVQL